MAASSAHVNCVYVNASLRVRRYIRMPRLLLWSSNVLFALLAKGKRLTFISPPCWRGSCWSMSLKRCSYCRIGMKLHNCKRRNGFSPLLHSRACEAIKNALLVIGWRWWRYCRFSFSNVTKALQDNRRQCIIFIDPAVGTGKVRILMSSSGCCRCMGG